MKYYHLHYKEKKIRDEQELNEILESNLICTISMCIKNKPYLITLDYIFNSENNCIYFHSAKKGKKIDYLLKNPKICGQIVDDLGYIQNQCSHAYRSIQFYGKVQFLEDIEQKREALELMIEKFEENPEPIKKRFITKNALKNVTVGKINIDRIIGKKSLK